MKTPNRRCKCLHCKGLFLPDHRNRGRQSYCAKPECRRISKRQSQERWLGKPENRDYFCGKDNSRRVREWQKSHPAYWKNATRYRKRTLQEACSKQPAVNQGVAPSDPVSTLQDLCSMQTPLLVGLISMLGGSTLQDDIAVTTRQLVTKGHDILGMVPGMKLERFHEKTSPQS